jgi:hypothetical protein
LPAAEEVVMTDDDAVDFDTQIETTKTTTTLRSKLMTMTMTM